MVYIKNIRIKGFKSYKELTKLEDFSPEHNVIVGRNGSGKSNFFFAIRFVLSDMFSNLRPDERLSLLHEGAGDRTMSGYVEIVFDNTDKRFPIDKDEVVLRRQIGMKKDEYYLDKKVITKSDVVNLLESAGFSRSNPYYIVQQGKVNGLTMMKDAERLELLKEVAGTRVYDERRAESDKIMAESDLKKEKIEESLSYIDERLKELEGEKNELKEYQELDRERRALEYTIYDKELNEAQDKLGEIDSSRVEEANKAKDQYKHSLETHREIKQLERDIKSAEVDVRRLNKEKESIDEERSDLIKTRAKLELTVAEAEDRIVSDKEEQARLKKEMSEVEALIAETTDKLDNTKPEFEEAQKEEREVQERSLDSDRRLNELYSKQGRSARFSNKKERDAWIKQQIKELRRTIDAQKEQIADLEQEIEELRNQTQEEDAKINETQKQLQEIRNSLEKNTKAYNDLTIKRDELSNKRKELWRQDSENENNMQMYRDEVKKAERQLNLTLAKVTSVGLSAVNQMVAKYQVRGVYGPLIELFECPEEFATAVEVTAGGSLFHVVVDTDATASKIIDAFNKEGVPGRVTFVPLNRVRVSHAPLPDTPDARPMIEELEFHPMFKPVFQQVFGKTLICRSIDVASDYAKSHGLNCVTIEGDQVNRKGALTGGFYDIRNSRIEAMKAIKAWKSKFTEIADSAKKIKAEAQDVDQEVNRTLGEIEKLKVRGEKKHDTYEQMSLDIKMLMKDQLTHRDLLEQKENTLATLNVSLRQLEESVRSYEAELGTALLDRLSPSEQSELSDLTKELTTLKETQIAVSSRRASLEAEKIRLQNFLSANLLKRRAELQEQIDHRKIAQQPATLEQKSKELERVEALIDDVTKRQKEIEKAIDEKTEQIRSQKVKIDKLKAKENDETLRVQSEAKIMEKLINKRSLLLQKKEECMRKIRELGSLPASVADYQEVARKELLTKLNDVNKRLGGYNQVNKKAFDQYVSFSEQREGLIARKKELDVGAEKIRELIKLLDQQKDKAIERTFKGVARHFQQVFSELVPDGKGQIVMQKMTGATTDDKIAQYTGVAIKVSFNKASETQHMQRLSGGQKSLVALALIFAIQRCDPAPFYLFDEIDSALDTPHRVAVANMIESQSKKEGGAQFITTTFRPELVNAATKCYGISFQHKVSTIHAISIKKALSIIKASEAEISGAGETRSLPGSAVKKPQKSDEEEEEEEEGGEKEEEEEEGEEMEEGGEEGGDAMEEGGEEEED